MKREGVYVADARNHLINEGIVRSRRHCHIITGYSKLTIYSLDDNRVRNTRKVLLNDRQCSERNNKHVLPQVISNGLKNKNIGDCPAVYRISWNKILARSNQPYHHVIELQTAPVIRVLRTFRTVVTYQQKFKARSGPSN